MPNSLVMKIIIGLARLLRCSPLLSHCLIMILVGVAFAFGNPDGAGIMLDPVFTSIYVGISFLVILATWWGAGDYRSEWAKAAPWR